MNRRQQPAPPRPSPNPRQSSRIPPSQQQQQQVPQYNPNSVGMQLPPQVTIPQAISILVARINQLEDKYATTPSTPNTVEIPVPVVDTKQMEEMASRIVKLEMDLLSAKDHIMKLQSFTLSVAKPLVAPSLPDEGGI